ncbi:MAG: hypothetical protein KJ970_10660 [Candidatus Eisenbacteria bacterium]|uniref:Uncharacterized protein n=1 Tax=Eiseniibacteriota bacterium TaxID=2212470 RepID=A0A948W6Q6_UNCEI|nr:hypothetical protein [Candidatus Eisenbacteria bacterium]MBU2691375.1 hypothetical protein [Candidatus Eisenbacteria bacterium]
MALGWLEVVMDEYRSLREESLRSMQLQQAVLRYGLAATGALIAVAFGIWGVVLLASVALLLFVPAVSYLSLIIWIGEVARMMRAGWYLKALEERVCQQFPDRPPPLGWENYLRTVSGHAGTPQLFWNYAAIIGLFLLLSMLAAAMGVVRLAGALPSAALIGISVLEFVVLVVVTLYVLSTGRRFR